MQLVNSQPAGANTGLRARDLLAAADACDRAAEAASPEQQARAVMEVLAHQETIKIGLMTARVQRIAGSHSDQVRRPLSAEGDDFGRVEARVPKDLLFHLSQQPNFGWDGLYSDEGMKDLLKAFPQCRVRTESGKLQVGYGSKRAPRSRVQFGRGTITFAT